MYALDFEYDNKLLSDFQFIICDFNASPGMNVVDVGSDIEFNRISRNNGRIFSLTGAKYTNCIATTFDICKNPDLFEYKDREITEDEFRSILRWLNRREFLDLVFLYDSMEKERCHYKASFNIDKITIRDIVYGLRLTMITDSPFGHADLVEELHELNGNSIIYIDESDEIGTIYPNLTITCLEAGDLYLYNSKMDTPTIIKNVSVNEVITIDGDAQIIQTSSEVHNLFDDFNYEFFKIGNTYYDKQNEISSSLHIRLVMKYSPVIRGTL